MIHNGGAVAPTPGGRGDNHTRHDTYLSEHIIKIKLEYVISGKAT